MKSDFAVWVLDSFVAVARSLSHCVLAIWYYGKGKAVPPVTNPLLLRTATQLAREIREGKLKSEDVVQAYIERIEEVEPYINATADCNFEIALKEARGVDSLIASGYYTKEKLADEKPLLGVPFTVKLLLKTKGLRSTGASRLYENVIANEDAPSVELMKKAGAIVIATTNSPEFGLNIESTNFVYGRTSNPYDVYRTPGGSSGGESALIAASGSLLGLGNDVAGSVRIPALWTGIFSHKPTRDLVPSEGNFPIPDSALYKFLHVGPMCRYAEDLIVSMQVLSSQSAVKVKFGQQVDLKKLKIYYLKEIKSPCISPVDDDIAVALKNAVSYFENRYGVVGEEIKMPFLFDANRCVFSQILKSITNIKSMLTLNNEKPINVKLDFLKYFFGKSVLTLSTLLLFICRPLCYNQSMAHFYQNMADKWIDMFNTFLDEETVLLMPTFPVTAPRHHESLFLGPNAAYTSIFNVLGLPSTHCPTGFSKQGLPLGVQIVARKYNDALTIACAVELEKAFGGWKSPGDIQANPECQQDLNPATKPNL